MVGRCPNNDAHRYERDGTGRTWVNNNPYLVSADESKKWMTVTAKAVDHRKRKQNKSESTPSTKAKPAKKSKKPAAKKAAPAKKKKATSEYDISDSEMSFDEDDFSVDGGMEVEPELTAKQVRSARPARRAAAAKAKYTFNEDDFSEE